MNKSVIFVLLVLYNLTSGEKTVNVADHSDKNNVTIAKISEPAPFWSAKGVLGDEIKEFKLTDFKDKYIVFFFYPLDFTFVCPTEITAFSDRIEEFKDLNAAVIGVSVDSEYTHLAWVNTPRKEGGIGRVGFPLISDLTHNISKAYGVYMENLGHTLRALFIIDKAGIIRQITINDLQVGRNVDEILRLLQAFHYTDDHKEVCPAGWKPGDDTIYPDPIAKKKYFKDKN